MMIHGKMPIVQVNSAQDPKLVRGTKTAKPPCIKWLKMMTIHISVTMME